MCPRVTPAGDTESGSPARPRGWNGVGAHLGDRSAHTLRRRRGAQAGGTGGRGGRRVPPSVSMECLRAGKLWDQARATQGTAADEGLGPGQRAVQCLCDPWAPQEGPRNSFHCPHRPRPVKPWAGQCADSVKTGASEAVTGPTGAGPTDPRNAGQPSGGPSLRLPLRPSLRVAPDSWDQGNGRARASELLALPAPRPYSVLSTPGRGRGPEPAEGELRCRAALTLTSPPPQ